jgi:ABC-type antimicrobial peptide transport system permease subunit
MLLHTVKKLLLLLLLLLLFSLVSLQLNIRVVINVDLMWNYAAEFQAFSGTSHHIVSNNYYKSHD